MFEGDEIINVKMNTLQLRNIIDMVDNKLFSYEKSFMNSTSATTKQIYKNYINYFTELSNSLESQLQEYFKIHKEKTNE